MFYAIERWADGFENNTWVDCIFRTKKEAQRYIDKVVEAEECLPNLIEIVPCKFGKPIKQIYD